MINVSDSEDSRAEYKSANEQSFSGKHFNFFFSYSKLIIHVFLQPGVDRGRPWGFFKLRILLDQKVKV